MTTMIRTQTVALSLLALLAALAPRAQATDYNDAASGNWNATSTWNPSTGYPGSSDTAVIDSHTVTANLSLTNGTAPASITVSSSGTVAHASGVVVASPVTMSGGTWAQGAMGPGAALRLTGPVTVTTNSLFTAQRNAYGIWLDGPVSGTGRLTFRGVDYWDVYSTPRYFLTCASNTHSGGMVVEGNYVDVVAVSNQSLGTGDITVNAAAYLSFQRTQDYTGAPRTPVITLATNTSVVRFTAADGTTVPFGLIAQGAGKLTTEGWRLGEVWSGAVTLNTNLTLAAWRAEGNATSMILSGQVSGPGGIVVNADDSYAGKQGVVELRHGTNTYAGGTLVRYGRLKVAADGALGTGPVTVWNTPIADYYGTRGYRTSLLLDATPDVNWTLANAMAGDGTISVEGGTGTNTLTVLGAVAPGTNTACSGILSVNGNLALGVGSQLKIEITGTNGVAGVDFDRLLVDHNLTGLSNAVLEVNVGASLGPGELAGQELVVVSNATALADTFAAVVWSASWGGVVKVDDPAGTVKLTTIQRNPDLPYVRATAATGVVETAAWLNGTVVATGTSETAVWVFWGQTSGGTNSGAWAASTNLGTCVSAPPADFTFEASGLVSGRTYVYRYYVENAAGGTWSPTEPSFRTFGPPLVDNAGGASALRGTSATLNGTVTAGRPNPDTFICWGTNDAGIVSTGAWAHVESLGALDGAFARGIGGLTPGQTYFYRCYTTNSYGADWADTAATFTTAAYDEFVWTGAGDVNWSTASNWNPSARAPTQAWDRVLFQDVAPRQPTVDRGLAVRDVLVTGTNGWTWSGSATATVGRAFDYGSSGTSTWNPALAGAGGVTVSAGQLTLGNTNNTFVGETWIKGGRLHAVAPGALGAAATPIRVGDTNGSADAILSFANGGVAVTYDRDITVDAGSTGRAVLWSQPGAGGQTLGGALTLGRDTEFRAEGSSALTLNASLSGAGALVKSGAQPLIYARTDNPGHAGGTRVQSGLLQWAYTQSSGSDTTLRFGGGAGLLTLDGGQFELKGTEDPGVRLTLDNPVRVTTNGGALAVWRSEVTATTYLPGAIDLGGSLTIGSLTAGSLGALSYRGPITLDQAAGGARALLLNHTGSDVEFRGAIADGAGTNALPLQVGITAGGAIGTPFKLSGTNATYASGTVFTGGRVTLTNPRAVGGGPLTVWSNAICHLARTGGATNWAFAQNLSGSGVVQVEAGTNTYQLLSQGATVSPGVRVGDVDTLTVAGRYAFGTNAVGQASRMSIDVIATSTNAADARADLLRVDHGDPALAASLAQCDLVVNLALPPGVSELQRTFTILTNTYDKASFTNQTFRSVTINGGAAAVRYASGYVALDVDIQPPPTGVLLIVR
jgi:fibronectin-binding autotransporter adhesin